MCAAGSINETAIRRSFFIQQTMSTNHDTFLLSISLSRRNVAAIDFDLRDLLNQSHIGENPWSGLFSAPGLFRLSYLFGLSSKTLDEAEMVLPVLSLTDRSPQGDPFPKRKAHA
jgi:hypothetical protein